jgi:hypothetical protein
MKALMKYWILLMAIFFFSPASAQTRRSETSSRQAEKQVKAEQQRERERRSNAKAAKRAQPNGETDAKYSHLTKEKKKIRFKRRKGREKDHTEFE